MEQVTEQGCFQRVFFGVVKSPSEFIENRVGVVIRPKPGNSAAKMWISNKEDAVILHDAPLFRPFAANVLPSRAVDSEGSWDARENNHEAHPGFRTFHFRPSLVCCEFEWRS